MYETNMASTGCTDTPTEKNAAFSDLDSRVEYWHTHELNCSLREYLGMNREEYELWMKYGEDALPDIIRGRNERVIRKAV